ncbi:hypothetical protein GC194_13120 [bacterium]|nr:hypothetical protein [bacterium]
MGKPQQFILTNEGYQLWDINGQQLWPETYAFVDTFDQVENAFWVGDDFMNRGIKKLEGSFLIDTQYNWLKQVGDTIYGAKWKVNPDFEEKDEGWQLPSGKQDLSQIQLFYFDENWNPRSITGYAKFKFISENFDMEWEPELYGYQLNKPNYEPFCLWALKRFLGTNKVQDNWAIGNDWQPAYFGTTLPKYRIPTEVVYYGPRYVDYSYHNIFIGSTVYGAAATIESNSGTIGPGAMGYTNSQFYNLVIDGDSVHNLKLWDVLDKKCIYVLNDTLAHKLKAKEIDVDCGKDGLVVYSLMEHFKVNDSSLAFLIKKGEYYENNYVSLKINLNDWPLTPYFIEKRKQFGQR